MMAKNIKTKNGIVIGLIAILVVISAFIGTTLAWFTDSVSSDLNKIVSGRLDVEMNYYNSATGDYEDASNVPLFNNDALWEPGYMDIAYLEIKNVGNLSFNYLFVVYPYEETKGYLSDGSEFYLSDYLVYAVVSYDVEADGVIESREEALELIKNAEMGLSEAGKQIGTMHPDTESKKLALIVYMPTYVTSEEANHDLSSGKPAPVVKLAVDVYATQNTYEADSFDNQYDAGLTPVWEVPLWRYAPENGYTVDIENKKITVNNAEGMKYLGQLYDDMMTHPNYDPSEWEIVLGADIDFGGEVLTEPIRMGGFKSFDGNDKIIYNVILNYILVDEELVSVGLFDSLPSTKNLTLDTVTVESTVGAAGILAGGLTGDSYSNITIRDSSASGVGFVGGLIGWGQFLHPIGFSGIQIFNPNLSLFGDGSGSAGGFAGYAGGSKITVSNSTVSGLDASDVDNAGSYVGGLFGELDADAVISQSTITEITVYKDVYVGSITGKIYDEKTVSVTNSTVAVQALANGEYKVIPLTPEGEIKDEGLEVDELGFPESALHTTFGGHYYQVVQQTVNWNVANQNCAAMYGHLATVTSAEENSALAAIVRNHGGSTWLGGVRSSENYNVFVWVTGEEMTYTNWDGGEPNDLNGEQCIHMYASDGTWNDYDYTSSSATAYACEWDSLQAYLNYLTDKEGN